MAGGINAQEVMCMECGAKATRTYEGCETDQYQCSAGHSFSLDWSRTDLPQTPLWPPPQQQLDIFHLFKKQRL